MGKSSAIAFVGLSLLVVTPSQASLGTYPRSFLWGAALSAHQTEGAFGGGESGDWYAFEHSKIDGKSPILNGDTADVADDEWHRYSEDLESARKIGLNTIRTSISWEKVEPAPGVFSQEALSHYRAVLQRMHELGIRPMIALHHFTHPVWFDRRGGWTSPDSPKLFLEYADRVVSDLGDLCDLWITFNEPMVLVSMAFLKGETPPFGHSLDEAYEAAFNLARAHRMVAAMIHARQGLSPGARGADGALRGVGLANSLAIYDPADSSNPKDRQAAQVLADLNNWDFLKSLFAGKLVFDIPSEVPHSHSFSRDFPEDDLKPWERSGPLLDWIGVNYYTAWRIRYDPWSAVRADWLTPPGPRSDNGSLIYPEGLERILRQTAERFSIPLAVTENGLSDAADTRRPDFIRAHLDSLDRAIRGSASGAPLDVRGYYHWSLIDNFEWNAGYSCHFGLIAVDYKNDLRRAARPSAETYAREVRERQIQ